MKKPLVSILIPVHGQWELTRQCLESLRETTSGDFFEVIVVDNASPDETSRDCPVLGAALFGARFHSLHLAANVGFGPALNHGAAHAAGEFLFFLNNDTLPSPGWLAPLIKAMGDDSRLGAVGPLLTYPDTDRVQHVGITFGPAGQPLHLYEQFPASHPLVGARRTLQALTAAALFMPRASFAQLGGFHEGYANGYEDMDLCLQLGASGGRMRCVCESRITHLTSQTPGRFDADDANAALFADRQGGAVIPDLHTHLARDGYSLRFTPWLLPVPCLAPEREDELTHAHGAAVEAGTLVEALAAEPLWEKGYDLLAEAMENKGRHDQVLAALRLKAFFFPSSQAFARLAEVASACGDHALAANAATSLGNIGHALADRSGLTARATALAAAASKAGQSELARAANDWLARTTS